MNYAQALRIDDIAAQVQMSTSSLHQHFRQLTTMSPLQYQKWLRLSEARRMIFNHNLNAASAAFEVGYGSASQFSREYTASLAYRPGAISKCCAGKRGADRHQPQQDAAAAQLRPMRS